VGGGMLLVVVGAILAFAVEDDVPGIDLRMTGLILMLAGAAAIAYARKGSERERVVTTTGTATPPPVDPGQVHRQAGQPLPEETEQLAPPPPPGIPEQHQVVHEVVRERGTDPYRS